MKLYLIIVFFFFLTSPTIAQQRIKIGDNAPAFSAFRWIKGNPGTELIKGRVYLIEFGATWCTPCARAIPELSRIAEQHKDKVDVISMFVMESNDHKDDTKPAYVTRVKNYISKREDQIKYSVAVDDPQKSMERAWLKNAGLDGIPHIFVIDPEGKIAAIESSPAIAEIMLNNILSRDYSVDNVVTKARQLEAATPKYDKTELLLINDNGGDENDFLFRSVLTAYDGRIRATSPTYISSHRFGPADSIFNYLKDRVQVIGGSISELYYMAYADTLSTMPYTRNMKNEYPDTVARPHLKKVYGRQWHMPVLEMTDTRPFVTDRKHIDNRYNYSLKVPSGAGTAAYLQQCLRSDLDKFFGYHVKVQKRKMPVWELSVLDNQKIKTKLLSPDPAQPYVNMDESDPFTFANAEMRDIIWMLSTHYGYAPYDYGKMTLPDQAAFVDKTNVNAKIDFTFNRLWSFNEMRSYLESVGLQIKKSSIRMDVLVITD